MAYNYRIFDSIEQVDIAAWQGAQPAGNSSIFMDPRFLAAVEVGMKQVHKFWYIVLHEEGVPVACTSASAMTVDLVDFADPRLARIVRRMPLLFSRLRHLKLLICGLPIGTGSHTLALAQRSASPGILPVLDGIIRDLAIEAKADAIIYKEFGKGDLDWTAPLLKLGYSRIPTPPAHFFTSVFEDFAQYCAALRNHYRWQIRRSRHKLKEAGLEIAVLSDPEEILRAYTPDVHALYHQTLERAAVRVEVIPIEFLHQLTLRLKGQVELITILKDRRIVAFGWCLCTRSSYHTMYMGLDYQLNRNFDLYFNLLYALLERGLQKRVSTIVFGISSDTFKAKLGCYSEPLYVFVKGRGAWIAFILRAAGSLLIARKPAASTAPFNIFKNKVAENSRDGGPTRTT